MYKNNTIAEKNLRKQITIERTDRAKIYIANLSILFY